MNIPDDIPSAVRQYGNHFLASLLCISNHNFWGFPGNPPKFLEVLEDGFVNFFKEDVAADPLKSEYLLPTIIGGMLNDGTCTVRTLPTTDTWYGMTYQEDVAAVKEAFGKLLEEGKYKEDLFSDL